MGHNVYKPVWLENCVLQERLCLVSTYSVCFLTGHPMAYGGRPEKEKKGGPGIGTLLGMGVAAALGAGILYGATKLHDYLSDEEKAAKKLSDDEEECTTEKSGYSYEVKVPECKHSDQPELDAKAENLHDGLESFYKQHVVDTVEDEISNETLTVIDDVVQMFRREYNKRRDVVGRVDEGSTAAMLRRTATVDGEDEFDVRIPIVLGRKRWKVVESCPGWLMLRARVGSDNLKLCATPDGYLSTTEMLGIFHGVCESLSKCENTQEYVITTDDAAKLVVEFAGWDTLKMNLLPQLVIDSKCLLADPVTEGGDDDDASKRWRQDFFLQEQQLLQGSAATSCVNKCLHIVSSVCHRNSHLDMITDGMLRTVMLRVLEEEDDWSEQSLPERFIDFFICLERYLLTGNLPQYFLPTVNLFDQLQPSTVDELKRYVSGIIGMHRFHELLKNVD